MAANDSLDIAKAVARIYRSSSKNNAEENPSLSARHGREADALDAVIAELENARRRLTPVSGEYGDISDLPPEVVAELNLTKLDELELQIRDIVASATNQIGLDPVIIELYRRHKVTHPRRFIMNKLYRMAQKGIVESVEGKKGVYRVAASATPAPVELDDDELPE